MSTLSVQHQEEEIEFDQYCTEELRFWRTKLNFLIGRLFYVLDSGHTVLDYVPKMCKLSLVFFTALLIWRYKCCFFCGAFCGARFFQRLRIVSGLCTNASVGHFLFELKVLGVANLCPSECSTLQSCRVQCFLSYMFQVFICQSSIVVGGTSPVFKIGSKFLIRIFSELISKMIFKIGFRFWIRFFIRLDFNAFHRNGFKNGFYDEKNFNFLIP